MSGNFNGIVRATLPLTGNEIFLVDTQLTQGLNPESETITLAQVAQTLSPIPAWNTGRFYGNQTGGTMASVLTISGNLYAVPTYIPNAVNIKSLNLSVTTGQTGGAAYIGLYADNGTGYPGTLVSGSSPAALAATTTAVVSNTVSININPGLYWMVSTYTATTTFPSVVGMTAVYTNGLSGLIGWDTAAHALATSGEAVTGLVYGSFTYGSLPTTFPTGATPQLNVSTPIIAIGV